MIAKLIALTEQTAYGHGVADAPNPVAVFEYADGRTETLSLDSVKFDAQLGDLADLVYAGTRYVAHKATAQKELCEICERIADDYPQYIIQRSTMTVKGNASELSVCDLHGNVLIKSCAFTRQDH